MKLRDCAAYLAMFFCWSVLAFGQAVSDANQTGFPVFGTFHGSDLDMVSLSNGNLHIEIPITSFPQRHGEFAYKFIYDTPSYVLTYYKDPAGVYWGVGTADNELVGINVGWRLSNPFNWQLNSRTNNLECSTTTGGPFVYTVYDNYYVSDPDGGKHPLPMRYVGPNGPAYCNDFLAQSSGFTLDGTGIFVDSSGKITLKDGTQVQGQTHRDTNGNSGSASSDMLGRNNLVQSNFINPSGSGYTLWTVNDSNANPQTFRVDWTMINVTSNFCPLRSGLTGGTAPCGEYSAPVGWQVPSRLTLPDGLYYQFTWNSDGTLQQINLPTGGSIAYTYGVMRFNGVYSGAGCVKTDPNCVPTTVYQVRQGVASRAVTNSGTTATWNYAGYPLARQSPGLPPYTTTVTDPQGNQQLHTFSCCGSSTSYETQVKYYQGSTATGTLLRTVNKDYAADASPLAVAEVINVRLIRETTILENGLTKKTETDYETSTATCNGCSQLTTYTITWLNPTNVREYDWGSGTPGPLLRTTSYTYLHAANANYLNANIADRPMSKTIYDGNGNVAAQSTFAYDGSPLTATSGAPNHDYTNYSSGYNLRGNLTQESHWLNTTGASLNISHAYDDLGNLRSTTDPKGNTITFSYSDNWANTGCVPAGVNTQAYATQVTNALGHKNNTAYYPCTGLVQARQDQNDINAGNSGTTSTFDGMNRPVTTSFPDGGSVSYDYSDNHSTGTPLSASSSTLIDPTVGSTTRITVLDGLGRAQQHKSSVPTAQCGSGYTFVDFTYDALGRAATTSNPYCTTSDPTYGLITNSYDALNRVTQVTKQDGSVSTAQYEQAAVVSSDATCTLATDEAGNQRKTCADGIGRLIEVDEPGGESPGSTASGGLTISGTLQSKSATSGTPGTGSITMAGSEQSKSGVGATPGSPGTSSVTINGSEQSVTTTTTTCGPPYLSCGGCTERDVTHTTYDSGTVTIWVNSHPDSYSYGANDNPGSVANGLYTAINNDTGAFVNAGISGSTLTLTARSSAAATNYSLTTGSTYDTVDFTQPSFTATAAASNLTGGTDANPGTTVYDSGTCTVKINGTPYSVSFSQGASTNSIAQALATAINGGSLASATASGATISVTAKTTGTASNYTLSGGSCSYNSTYFGGASFVVNSPPAGLTGGTSGSPAATDAGTVQMSVGGYSATANYGNGTGQDSTATAVASDLVAKIQAQLPASNPPFTISANGAGISYTWGSVGTAGNVTVNTISSTTQTAYFSTPSFAPCTISANPQNCSTALSGGSNPSSGSLSTPYVTLYSYDTLGNLTCAVQKGLDTSAFSTCAAAPASWRPRSFTYDSLSRLLTAQNPESGTINYSFDATGNLLQKKSPAPNAQVGSTATQTITYCYDALNRVTGKAYSAQNCTNGLLPSGTAVVSFTYDQGTNGIGHISHLNDQAGSADYTYDIMGRVVSESRTINPGGSHGAVSRSMSYAYYLNGSPKTLTYPSNGVIKYTPDTAGHDVSAIDSGNGINYVTGATSGPDGSLTGFVSGNSGSFTGITNTFSLNKRMQPVFMSAATPTQTVFSIGYDFHSGIGDNGNVYALTNNKDNTRNQTFTYDALNRLTSAQNAGTDCSQKPLNPNQTKFWGNSYGYDAWGNLLQKNVTKCAAEYLSVTALNNNQLLGYGYDAAGNMTSDLTDGVSATYDAENRISAATKNGITTTYTYDADANRVEKTNGSSGTLYWYMSPGVVAESDLSGNLQSEYIFFRGARVARKDLPTNAVSYYFSDHLKTTDIVTDAQGNIKNESDFYPYGGELQFANGDSNHYKFTGKERDSETGLDYFGARYYSNGLGRWISADWSATPVPVPYADFGDPQSLNLYGYVRGLPTTRFDADGHDWWDEVKGTAIGTANFVGHVAKGIAISTIPVYGPKVVADGIVSSVTVAAQDYYNKGVSGVANEVLDQGPQGAMEVVTEAVLTGGLVASGGVDGVMPESFGAPDANVVVRGGQSEMPAAGTKFSGSQGATVEDAAQGVPHGTIRQSTAGEIRKAGGSVRSKPELTRNGTMNNKHVNVKEGTNKPSTFSQPKANPVPKKDRIDGGKG